MQMHVPLAALGTLLDLPPAVSVTGVDATEGTVVLHLAGVPAGSSDAEGRVSAEYECSTTGRRSFVRFKTPEPPEPEPAPAPSPPRQVETVTDTGLAHVEPEPEPEQAQDRPVGGATPVLGPGPESPEPEPPSRPESPEPEQPKPKRRRSSGGK